MALSAGGIGSGLDVNGIISQLMALERQPLERLRAQRSQLDARLSAYGQLQSALSTFKNAMSNLGSTDKFQVFSAASSNEESFTATAGSAASVASHSIQVEALANAHKFTSNNSGGAGYADADTSIGTTGTLEIAQGGASFQITIDGTNNTLAGIREAINNAEDNTGVTASIVNTGSESILVLNANESGVDNEISVGAATTASVATALDFGTIAGNEARDASVIVNGIAISSASNVVTDAISGVTLNLHKAEPGVIETLNVARDTDKVKESVQNFVDAYNDLRTTIRTLGGEDATLQGDTGLLSIERQLQAVFNQRNGSGVYGYLTEVGLSTAQDGSLTLDSTRLDAAINSNFADLANLFGHSTEGFAVRLETVADGLVASNGLIDARRDGISSRISSLDNRRENLEFRMEIIEERYTRQFSALDSLISQLQSTGSFLSQQLAALPAPNSIRNN